MTNAVGEDVLRRCRGQAASRQVNVTQEESDMVYGDTLDDYKEEEGGKGVEFSC